VPEKVGRGDRWNSASSELWPSVTARGLTSPGRSPADMVVNNNNDDDDDDDNNNNNNNNANDNNIKNNDDDRTQQQQQQQQQKSSRHDRAHVCKCAKTVCIRFVVGRPLTVNPERNHFSAVNL
jgi:hypothetical protein